jgi:1-pyrroline-5-carboxylate dehydrogenase
MALPEFRNEPYVDFNDPTHAEKMKAALALIEGEVGKEYPIKIGGERIKTDETFNSINPADTEQVIGVFAKGTKELAGKAVETALETYKTWRKVHPVVRARYLLRAAQVMRRRAYELSACMVYEVGKNWLEAYADTAEAIDFLDFYAREMMRLSQPVPLTPFPGEENNVYYMPLGVGVVIPPWNFPLAILVGMTSAAFVAGNTVVLKPASASPVIAAKFFEILEEVHLPPGVVNFLPGPGGSVGDTLVDHPKTRFIAFTGSREIGLRIFERAAKPQPGQIWLKRTILEMGGKDCIVVDDTANLDAAAEGIVAAAFGFQGQKCSACSRAIVTAGVYDKVLDKVVERAKKITVGPTKDWANFMGPVVDENAYRKILEYIEIGKGEGRCVLGGDKAPGNGYFIQPTIIADVKPGARIEQEEIFGPVLAFIKADDFDNAIEIANDTEYGLTGALFSQDRTHLERARWELEAGNLYLNRKCTGALVNVQPFGGFNMSGTDSKAGGRDYLLLFTQAKTVAERL